MPCARTSSWTSRTSSPPAPTSSPPRGTISCPALPASAPCEPPAVRSAVSGPTVGYGRGSVPAGNPTTLTYITGAANRPDGLFASPCIPRPGVVRRSTFSFWLVTRFAALRGRTDAPAPLDRAGSYGPVRVGDRPAYGVDVLTRPEATSMLVRTAPRPGRAGSKAWHTTMSARYGPY